MKKIILSILALCSLTILASLGLSADTASGLLNPTGSFTCISATTTSITMSVTWANTGTSGARLYRGGAGTYIKDFTPTYGGTAVYTDSGLTAASTYQYELHTGSKTSAGDTTVILDRHNCTTAPPASGTLSCTGSTASDITLAAAYNDAGTDGAAVYRSNLNTAIATYNTPSGGGAVNDHGLTPGMNYKYQLRSGSAILKEASCSTTAAATTPTASQPVSSSSSTASPAADSTSSNTAVSPTSTNGGSSATTADTSPQSVKFNQQQVLKLVDTNSPAADLGDIKTAAAVAGTTGTTFHFLLLILLLLFVLCAFVISRFRRVFSQLDRNKSGLRRRIIIIVTLPSLIPLLGLGFLGYQQLSKSVKSSLSSQLERAAHTSSLKLDREFAIRRSVVTKTASDILQIKSQYADQQTQLAAQKDRCATLVQSAIPRSQYSTVTHDDSCLPFLTGFAQLAGGSNTKAVSFLTALDQGAQLASADITAQEAQRIDELLTSVRHFFPDVLELTIVDANQEATVKAELPRTNSRQKSLLQTHSELLKQASSSNLTLFEATPAVRQLLMTYPIVEGGKTLGGVVAAYDTESKWFVPTIWASTPKPYAADQVFFVTKTGAVVSPKSTDKQLSRQLQTLSKAAVGKDYELKLASQTLITRTSPVVNSNWVVAVGAPASSVYAPLGGIQRTALLAIAGFLLLSVVLGIWFVGGIASEIERLLRGALAFATGDLDYRIGLKSHDELQVLGETMNNMATDIKNAQNALVEKDKEFINIATHELRAPMTSILGNLSMITEEGMGNVDQTARDLIDQAYLGTVRLRDIVSDMLDIARLESGHSELKPEVINIAELAHSVLSMQAAAAQQAGIVLKHEAQPTVAVLADKNKLQIVLTNFISNGIKYNRPGGSVTIAFKQQAGRVITSVADTGLGIPEDQKAHIFEKFYRVQDEDRVNVPGTGLGMHITKRFVETMGGEAWFESVHGQGTTFYFSLPEAVA